MPERSSPIAWLVGGALVSLTVVAFAQVSELGFIDFDDPGYVSDNPMVQAGLSLDSAKWAFTTGSESNWFPVARLSHMLDVELYGLEPAGHHTTNAVIHVVNVLLLFGFLRKMTGSLWRSALVAVLFAVHPLRVESVAWVSERKDVLSTCFGLLSAFAYVDYVRKPGVARYAAAAALFAISLMAKPMLVTLPVVFLLLDYWPLDRWRLKEKRKTGRKDTRGARGRSRKVEAKGLSFWQLFAEKLPLFALSLASSVVTYFVQDAGKSVVGGESLPLPFRLANAIVSYVRYLGMTIWPTELGLLYPHPYMSGGNPLAWWEIAGAALILVLATALALRARRQRYVVVGWLWYLVTLVPTIGLIQVGRQALADRYTYVPLVGVFIIAVWGGATLLERLPRAARALAFVGIGVVIALLVWLSRLQVETWRDSRSVFEHAVAVSPSSMIYFNLGNGYAAEGNFLHAVEQYRAALAIQPSYPEVSTNLGSALYELHRFEESIPHFRTAIRLNGALPLAHRGLALSLERTGDVQGAIEHWNIMKRLQQEHEADAARDPARGR